MEKDINFRSSLSTAENYEFIQNSVISKLGNLKENGVVRIGFVSGPINNTPDRRLAKQNLTNLNEITINLREQNEFPIFSSIDMFPDGLWNKLPETKLPKEERSLLLRNLFRSILSSGITDIYMAPGWKESGGARDEYETAIKLNLNIHDLDPSQDDTNS